MGQSKIITTEQASVLDQIRQNNYLCTNFYFTGGTALSEYYLQHRYSEDLDFFTEKPYEQKLIINFISNLCKQNQWTYELKTVEMLMTFYLHIGTITLKVDFSHYPHQRVEKKYIDHGLAIDSLTDIGINKLTTIFQRTQVKDFVDCYFLFKKLNLWDLIYGAEVKFRQKIEPWLLATELMNVDKFTEMPRMIKSLTLMQLKTNFHQLADRFAKPKTKR